MSVVLTVKVFSIPVGTGDFFFSFFSTVAARLENENWGSRFPVIMNELYDGCIPPKHLRRAEKELLQIKNELKQLPKTAVIWDFEDRSKQPPWGDNISETIHDMSDYFVTSGGKNLLDEIGKSIEIARRIQEPILVESL